MSTGALALHEGVLFVGRYTSGGEVLVFDLDGRQLEAGFHLPPMQGASGVALAGLAVDSDRKLWMADVQSGRVRCANLFGREGADFAPAPGKLEAPMSVLLSASSAAAPIGIALAETSKWTGVFVATSGKSVGAVGLYLANGHRLLVLRSLGNPKAPFDRISGLTSFRNILWVVEAGARRIQVFRDGEFHFCFDGGRLSDRALEPEGIPRALAPVGDGRVVVVVEESTEGCASANTGLFLVSERGKPLCQLAATGTEEGRISHPVDVVVEEIRPWPHESEAEVDRRRRILVLDRDGDRIQVFNMAGRCYGAFPEFEECQKSRVPLEKPLQS